VTFCYQLKALVTLVIKNVRGAYRDLTNERDFPYSKRAVARTASKCQD